MAPSRNRQSTNRRRRTTIPPLLPHQRFPKAIRDELRMTAALRCFSTLRTGAQKTQQQQQHLLYDYYHGNGNKYPSQIQLLTEGTSFYRDLYDVKTQTIVVNKKKGKAQRIGRKSLVLKPLLSREDFMTFTAGEEINCVDLKKKHRVSSDEPLSGRNLLDMARRGMKDFRKAMAFAKDKWDLKKNQPIESGTTVDDCIEYVRRRMYLLTHISIEDDNDDNDERSTKKIKTNKEVDITVDVASSAKSTKIDDMNDDVDDPSSNDDDTELEVDSIDDRKQGSKKTNDDGDESYKVQSGEDEDGDNDDNDEDIIIYDDDDDDDEDDDEIPYNWVFNSYMAFVMWGPFVNKEKQLSLFLLGKYNHLFYFIV